MGYFERFHSFTTVLVPLMFGLFLRADLSKGGFKVAPGSRNDLRANIANNSVKQICFAIPGPRSPDPLPVGSSQALPAGTGGAKGNKTKIAEAAAGCSRFLRRPFGGRGGSQPALCTCLLQKKRWGFGEIFYFILVNLRAAAATAAAALGARRARSCLAAPGPAGIAAAPGRADRKSVV